MRSIFFPEIKTLSFSIRQQYVKSKKWTLTQELGQQQRTAGSYSQEHTKATAVATHKFTAAVLPHCSVFTEFTFTQNMETYPVITLLHCPPLSHNTFHYITGCETGTEHPFSHLRMRSNPST